MLVEHEFLTTLGGEVSLRLAEEHLRAQGFEPSDTGADVLEMRRGRKRPSAGVSPLDLPQRVRVRFDRGRVGVAAVLEEHGKVRPLDSDLMLTVVRSLEQLLIDGQYSEVMLRELERVHDQIDAMEARRKRRNRIITVCVLGVLAVIIVLVVMQLL